MTYVITQNCCNDASCVAACPVGCIHPTPEEPGFATADMLYIDPATCIDCGACADACPVDAIRPDTALTPDTELYLDLNAAYYRTHTPTPQFTRIPRPVPLVTSETPLRVAIVGSGPAGFYSAKELLHHPGVQVDMFERLPVPYGLVRHGVAPDHPATKSVVDQFTFSPDKQRRLRMHLGVHLGVHIDHLDLLAQHHAVIYACGAEQPRRLEVPGALLPGVVYANALAGWYNDHPEHRSLTPNLDTRRAVVIGNGNVALDIARILTTEPGAGTANTMPGYARDALRHSKIDEVVILGRRGPQHASFTVPELLALTRLPGVDLIIDPADLSEDLFEEPPADSGARAKLELLATAAQMTPTPGNKRIVLQFNTTPTQVRGTHAVTAVAARRCGDSDEHVVVDTGLVVPAIGYEGRPIAGVGFDPATGTIPNRGGRVLGDDGRAVTGVYTAGWIKRGPTGVIGTNRSCAKETVSHLLDDHRAGLLAEPVANSRKSRARQSVTLGKVS